jgi:hypothetical protein
MSVLELKAGMVSFSGSFVKTLWKKSIQKFGLTFVFNMYLSIVIYDALNIASFNFGFRLDKSPKYLRVIFGFLTYFLLIAHLL